MKNFNFNDRTIHGIGFGLTILSVFILYVIQSESIIFGILEGLFIVLMIWFGMGTGLWLVAKHLAQEEFAYFRFLLGWYPSLYSQKVKAWIVSYDSHAIVEDLKSIFKYKKKTISEDFKWTTESPSIPGYYWAVLKDQDSMEMVLMTRCGRAAVSPTIDGIEYSPDCFDCWSDRLIPPDIEAARLKCFHHKQ